MDLPPTPKQIAFLTYWKQPIPRTRDDASEQVSTLIERIDGNPKLTEKNDAWRIERLFLFPDAYPQELTEFKANRTKALYQFNYETRGEDNPLRRITKEECQQLINWLDANHSGWDRNLYDWLGVIKEESFYTWFVGAAASAAPHMIKKGVYLKPSFHRPPQTQSQSPVRKAFVIAAWTILAGLLIVAALFYLLPK